MPEIYTFDEQGMRKLVAAYRSLQNDFSDLRRHLANQSPPVVYNAEKPVKFRNDSGETIPAHGVMRVVSMDTSPNDFHLVEKPNSSFKCRYLVNNDDPIPANRFGNGTWLEKSGRVLYNDASGTPATDEEWGAKENQWSLQKNRPGFLITGGSTSTGGVFKTRAKQHIVTGLKGKSSGNISKGSTGSVNIYMGASGSEAATEYFIPCRALGAAITADKWTVAWLESGVWYVAQWECS